MELSILDSLEWRMRSLTPICFAEYFTKLLPLPQNFKRRPVRQIIIQTQFRPSIVGASAVLCALSRLFPGEYNDFRAAIFRLLSGREAELSKCMAAIDTVFEAKLRALSVKSEELRSSEPPKPAAGELSSSLPAGATTGASSGPRQIGGAETPTGSRRTGEISMSCLEAVVPPGARIKDITGEPTRDVGGRISRRSGKEPAVEDIIVEIDKVQELAESD